MADAPHHPPPDPAHLRYDIACDVVESLHELLPPPSIDTPEAWERRDLLAVGRVTALAPATFEEADFATNYVACQAHSRDCLRLAARRGTDPKDVAKLLAQQARMGREARGWHSALTRMQAARRKEQSSDTTRNHAAGIAPDMAAPDTPVPEMAGLITQALAVLSPLPPPPPAPEAAAPPAEDVPPRPLAWSDLSEEEQRRSLLRQEADRYAIYNTVRAKQIRQLGGLPPDCDYEPPRPEILDLIVHGQTRTLRWADTYDAWVAPTE